MVRAATLIGLVLLTSCKKPEPYDNTLDVLRMQGEVNFLKSRVESLERDAAENRRLSNTVLKRGDEGYALAQSDIGGITVQLKKISDEGGSARVTLQIGNATSATITTTQIYAAWGPADKDGNPDSSVKAHTLSPVIKQPLRPGTWSTVSFPVNGAKAADIGYIRIFSIGANSITLGT